MNPTRHRQAVAVTLVLLGASPISRTHGADEAPAPADSRSRPGYALVLAPAKQVRAELTLQVEAPRLSARDWVVYAAQLPVLTCQTGVSSTLMPEGSPARELSAAHRPILRARIAGNTPDREQRLDVRLDYQTTLWSRRLVRDPTGQGAPAATPIGPEERRTALASGGNFDFNSEPFRRWLDDRGLRRGPDEGEIDFARRVFLAVKGGFTYAHRDSMDRHASRVCRAGESDCGGLAVVFASALRSNGIPARVLVGRWALSSAVVAGRVYDQRHCKAEFHAPGVGWVPADVSSALVHDKSPEGLAYFGNDPGDFLVMHLDTNLICDTVHFGRKPVEWLQAPAYWAVGSGTFDQAVTRESWGVTTSPAPELVEATLKKPATGTDAERSQRARPAAAPR
jgi:transglutaminase-like putative cysteine protease